MKKLKLMLNAGEMISREEMRKISGGYGDEQCLQFTCGETCPTAAGWCSCVFITEGEPSMCFGG